MKQLHLVQFFIALSFFYSAHAMDDGGGPAGGGAADGDDPQEFQFIDPAQPELIRPDIKKIQELKKALEESLKNIRKLLDNTYSAVRTKAIENIEQCLDHISSLQRTLHPHAQTPLVCHVLPSLLHALVRALDGSKQQLEKAKESLYEKNRDRIIPIARALANGHQAQAQLESLFCIFAQHPVPIARPSKSTEHAIIDSPIPSLLELLHGYDSLPDNMPTLCQECKKFWQIPGLWCRNCHAKNQGQRSGQTHTPDKPWYEHAARVLQTGAHFADDTHAKLLMGLDDQHVLHYLENRIGRTSEQNRHKKAEALIRSLKKTCGMSVQAAEVISKIPSENLNCAILLTILRAPHPTVLVAPERVTAIAEGLVRRGKVGKFILGIFAGKETIQGLEKSIEQEMTNADIIRVTNALLDKYDIPKDTLCKILELHSQEIDYVAQHLAQFLQENKDDAAQIGRKLEELETHLCQKSRIRHLGTGLSEYLRAMGQAWLAARQEEDGGGGGGSQYDADQLFGAAAGEDEQHAAGHASRRLPVASRYIPPLALRSQRAVFPSDQVASVNLDEIFKKR